MNVLHRILLFVLLGSIAFAGDEPLNGTQAAERVVIPKIQFKGTDIHEAAEALRQISWRIEKQPKRLNVIVALKPGPPRPPVTLSKENGTMMAILKEAAEQAGCEVQGEAHGVVIRDKGAGPLPAIVAEPGVDLQAIQAKLDKIIFPRVDLRQATAREAIEFIIAKQKQLAPDGGASIVLKLGGRALAADLPPPPPQAASIPGLPGNLNAAPAPAAPAFAQDPTRITMQASNIPLMDLLRYVAGLVDQKVTVGKAGIVVEPIKAE